MEELIKRLSRYSEQCVAYKLDANFAEAITDAITILKMADAMNGLNYILFLSERERGDHFKQAYHDEVNAKAEALEKYSGFARWVAKEVVCSDEEWENKHWAIQELLCRKLAKMGIITVDAEQYIYEHDDEGEEDVIPVKHGKWLVYENEGIEDDIYSCSLCGWTSDIEGTPHDNKMNYCPNCGARMDGGT